jgi:hypothetical protein
MKNLYLIASMLLVGSFAFGQRTSGLKGFEQRGYKLSQQDGRIDSQIDASLNTDREEIEIWMETFEGAVNGDGIITTDMGEWTLTGPHANVWTHSVLPSDGCWSAGNELPDFVTVANGFAMFDADNFNCVDPDATPDPIFNQDALDGSLVSPVLDFTDYDAVILEFSHAYRWCCTSLETYVEYSIDGGTNWTSIALEVGTANIGVEETVTVNLSCDLGGQSNVLVRWTWNSASHYYWYVDDVRFYAPEPNDLKLESFSYSQWENATAEDYQDLKYTMYHESQVRPLNLQGKVTNNGSEAQTNVVLTVDVTGPAGNTMVSSDPITVLPCETVTIDIPWTPEGDLGEYELNFIVTQDEEDVDISDNEGSTMLWVDDVNFARDNRSAGGGFTNFDNDYKIGNMFEMSQDAMIYGISFGLRNTSITGTTFNGELLNVDLDYVTETTLGAITSGNTNAVGQENIYTLALESPYEAIQGEAVCPVINHFGGADDVIIALSGTSPDQTSFLYEGSEVTWYYVTSTPMVRLAMADLTSIADVEAVNGITLSQNMPNPARDYTILVFNLENVNANVSLEIHDMSGRLVQSENFGKRSAGNYTEVINTEALNAGIYLYSLVSGNDRVTKRMSIVK